MRSRSLRNRAPKDSVAAMAASLAIPLAGGAQAAPLTTESAVTETASSGWEFIAAYPTYQQCVDAGAWYNWTRWYCAWSGSTYDLYALY